VPHPFITLQLNTPSQSLQFEDLPIGHLHRTLQFLLHIPQNLLTLVLFSIKSQQQGLGLTVALLFFLLESRNPFIGLFLFYPWCLFFEHLNKFALKIPNIFFDHFQLLRMILLMLHRGIDLVEYRFGQYHLGNFVTRQEDNDDEEENVERVQKKKTLEELERRDQSESEELQDRRSRVHRQRFKKFHSIIKIIRSRQL
jgi:hypothetical protein